MVNLPSGIYQHYKGKKYLVLGVAKRSETQEDLVVYITLYENDMVSMWVHSLTMFTENVVIDGKTVPRFNKIN